MAESTCVRKYGDSWCETHLSYFNENGERCQEAMIARINELTLQLHQAESKLERARLELWGWETNFPCDGGCTDEPREHCSRHGLRPVNLWDAARRDHEALQQIEALVHLVYGDRSYDREAFRDDLRDALQRDARVDFG